MRCLLVAAIVLAGLALDQAAAGEATRTDLAEVAARLAAARSALYAAQAQYAAERARYLAIIGVSPRELTRKRSPARAKRR